VITSLAGSRSEDIRERERRYIFAMLFRVVCLVGAVLLFSGPLQVAGIIVAVIMPWLAVIFANQPRARKQAPTLTVEDARPRERGLTASRPHQIIDMD
jgi:hypothetical protein